MPDIRIDGQRGVRSKSRDVFAHGRRRNAVLLTATDQHWLAYLFDNRVVVDVAREQSLAHIGGNCCGAANKEANILWRRLFVNSKAGKLLKRRDGFAEVL